MSRFGWIPAVAVPLALAWIWHRHIHAYPIYDAADYFLTAQNIYKYYLSAGWLSGLWHAYVTRGWKPLIFPALTWPALVFAKGHVRLAVEIGMSAWLALFALYAHRLLGVVGALFLVTQPWILHSAFVFQTELPFMALLLVAAYHARGGGVFLGLAACTRPFETALLVLGGAREWRKFRRALTVAALLAGAWFAPFLPSLLNAFWQGAIHPALVAKEGLHLWRDFFAAQGFYLAAVALLVWRPRFEFFLILTPSLLWLLLKGNPESRYFFGAALFAFASFAHAAARSKYVWLLIPAILLNTLWTYEIATQHELVPLTALRTWVGWNETTLQWRPLVREEDPALLLFQRLHETTPAQRLGVIRLNLQDESRIFEPQILQVLNNEAGASFEFGSVFDSESRSTEEWRTLLSEKFDGLLVGATGEATDSWPISQYGAHLLREEDPTWRSAGEIPLAEGHARLFERR